MRTQKKTRAQRENPLFDYKAFVSKRELYIKLLTTCLAKPKDKAAKAALKDLLSPYADAFSLLKYSTPFSVRALTTGFSKALDIDPSALNDDIESKKLAKYLLDIDPTKTDLEHYVDWFVDQTVRLYELVVEPENFSVALNELTELYNKESYGWDADDSWFRFVFEDPSADESQFRAELKRQLLDDAVRKKKYQFVVSAWRPSSQYITLFSSTNERDGRNPNLEIKIKQGFLGALAVYYFGNHFASLEGARSLAPFAAIKEFPDGLDDQDIADRNIRERSGNLNIDSQLLMHRVPFWYAASIESLDFFNVGIHFTRTGEIYGSGITPTNLKTKLADYTRGAVATYGRNLPMVSRDTSTRALIHVWHTDDIEYQRTKTGGEPEHYGVFLVFIFANAMLSFFKTTDQDHESVSLLQDVVEAIPFFVRKHTRKSPIEAYFGLSADGTKPLYDVDFSSWDEDDDLHYSYFVYQALCEYLAGPEYRIEHNINQTIKPLDYK